MSGASKDEDQGPTPEAFVARRQSSSSVLWAAVIILLGGAAIQRLTTLKADALVWPLIYLVVTSLGTYAAVLKLIPATAALCLKKGMQGRDINKNREIIPEALGIVPGTVFLFATVLFQPFFFAGATDLNLGQQYNAAIMSTCFMILLGFADDVFDLRWSVKIFSSFLATLPLLVAYNGSTYVAVPQPLIPFLPLTEGLPTTSVNLGILYFVYMALLGVFCTNSINIFAGVNGLEAGQSFIIAIAVLIHNIIEFGGPESDAHFLSFCLILPFTAGTLGLLIYNWFPSQVFVGDTFTYFAGMTLAMAGITGHFSKTLMLFFAPQIINFLLSLPQLFNTKWLPCPRHRLPRLNTTTRKLECIRTNWTLINLVLFFIGPQYEGTLTKILLVFQILCCSLAFGIRYYVASYFYP